MHAQSPLVILVGTHVDHPKCTISYLERVQRELDSHYKPNYPISEIFFLNAGKKDTMMKKCESVLGTASTSS